MQPYCISRQVMSHQDPYSSLPVKDPPRFLAVPCLLFPDTGAVRHKRQGTPQILEA